MNENFEEIMQRIRQATGTRTQVELAEVLAIRQSSISDAKRRQSVPADWFLKLYRTFGLNPDWVMEGQDPMYLKPELKNVNLAEVVSETPGSYSRSPARSRTVNVSTMAGKVDAEGGWEPEFVGQLCIPETFHFTDLVAVKVDGSAMEPLIRRGSYVGIDTTAKRVLSGEVYAVYNPQEGLALRRVYYDADRNVFLLRAEHPDHPEQILPVERRDEVILGRCVWVLQNLG